MGGAPMGVGAPPMVNPEVMGWFQAVDTDRSGRITALELQQALTNSNWSHFNAETCRLMIGSYMLCILNYIYVTANLWSLADL